MRLPHRSLPDNILSQRKSGRENEENFQLQCGICNSVGDNNLCNKETRVKLKKANFMWLKMG